MLTRNFKVLNDTGLHARPASELCKICKGFKSNANILFGEKNVNLKSVISILTGEITKDSEITVQVNGEDEQKAMEALHVFFENLDD